MMCSILPIMCQFFLFFFYLKRMPCNWTGLEWPDLTLQRHSANSHKQNPSMKDQFDVHFCFLMAHSILHLPCNSYNIKEKSWDSERTHNLGFCKFVLAQSGFFFASYSKKKNILKQIYCSFSWYYRKEKSRYGYFLFNLVPTHPWKCDTLGL